MSTLGSYTWVGASHEASETWWETDNLRLCVKAGWLCGGAFRRPDVTSQLCQMLASGRSRRRRASEQPSFPGSLSPEASGSRRKRKSPAADGGHLLQLAHSSIVSLSYVTYSCFSLWQRSQAGPFSFAWDTKRGDGWGKKKKKSWRGLSSLQLKFSEIARAPGEEQD